MQLTTEMFVLVIYIAGLPLCFKLFSSLTLPGGKHFSLAYLSFTISNIFTVFETWFAETLLNIFEHLSITLGTMFLFLAVRKIVEHNNKRLLK